MSRRTALAAIAVFILVVASVCALGAARYTVAEKQNGIAVTGMATNIDRLREFFDISDHGAIYTGHDRPRVHPIGDWQNGHDAGSQG